VSKKKPSGPEDPFASIPPRESFDAFPAMSAFPENAIAFLTGKTPLSAADEDQPHSKPALQPTRKQSPRPDSATDGQSAPEPTEQAAEKTVRRTQDAPLSRAELRPAAPSATPIINQAASLTVSQTENPAQQPSLPPSQSLTRGHSEDLQANLLPDLSQSLSLGRLKVSDRLNHNQRRVLDLLLAVKPYIIKFRDIASALDMREASVRTILRRLEALSFLSFQKARDGNIQGVRVAFNQHVIEQYQQDQTISLSENISQNLSLNPYPGATPSPRSGMTTSPQPNQPLSPSISTSPSPSPLLKIDREEILSIENCLGWDDAFLELMWPCVYEAGFRLEQVGQALAAREKLGKPLDRELIALSLDRADWELEEKGQLVNVATGERVRNVAAYIFTALARWGALRAHPEYVSREEKEAAGAVDEVRRRREAAIALETARFDGWVAGLSQEEMDAVMKGFPGGSREAWLKKHWRTHVRDGQGGA